MGNLVGLLPVIIYVTFITSPLTLHSGDQIPLTDLVHIAHSLTVERGQNAHSLTVERGQNAHHVPRLQRVRAFKKRNSTFS